MIIQLNENEKKVIDTLLYSITVSLTMFASYKDSQEYKELKLISDKLTRVKEGLDVDITDILINYLNELKESEQNEIDNQVIIDIINKIIDPKK